MFLRGNKLIKWDRKDKTYFLIGSLFSLVTSGCAASLPFIISILTRKVDDIEQTTNNSQSLSFMGWMVGLMILLGIISIICAFISKKYLSKLSSKKISEIRTKIFNNIQYLSPEDLKKYDNTSLMTRLTIDVYNYNNFYNFWLVNVFPSIVRWFVFLIMSFILNYIIAFILIGISFFLYMIVFLFARSSIKHYEVNLEKIDEINKITQENIVGSRVIKSFNLFNRQKLRFDKTNKEARDSGIHADTKAYISWPFSVALVNSVAIIIVLIATIFNWKGIYFYGTQIDASVVVGLISYSYLILWSTFDLGFLEIYRSRSLTSKKRMFEIINLKTQNINENGDNFEYGSIEFKNVSFKYNLNSTEYVLKDISFKIEPNSSLGIIGQTGSGKSTLLMLLARLYDPTEGDIFINGKNIREIKTSSLLDSISFAFQKKLLFSGTIEDNLRVSNENITNEEIEKVLKIAQLDNFVKSKDNGIKYELQERGTNLSGGQQQRLNIARAIAKKSNIYIFDDATSALDNITESKILNSLFKNVKYSTLILSSQKISSIKDMDTIIVLDKGKISAIGKHEELLEINSTYKEIYDFQYKRGDK